MADTLLGALVEKFQGTVALVAAVPSGIWVGEIPEGKALPFVCLVHQGEVPDWTFERDYLEEGSVQFLCYAKTCAAAESIATLVKAAFDWVTLTVTAAQSVQVERTNYVVSVAEFRASDGEIVYQAAVEYRTRVKKVY